MSCSCGVAQQARDCSDLGFELQGNPGPVYPLETKSKKTRTKQTARARKARKKILIACRRPAHGSPPPGSWHRCQATTLFQHGGTASGEPSGGLLQFSAITCQRASDRSAAPAWQRRSCTHHSWEYRQTGWCTLERYSRGPSSASCPVGRAQGQIRKNSGNISLTW